MISALVGIVGFFFVWGVFLSTGTGGDTIGTFLDLPSFLMVVLVPTMIMLAIYGWNGIVEACSWVTRRPAPGASADDAVTFFQLAAGLALSTGFLGTLVGLVIMLRNMDEPSRLGPGMAVTLLTQLYGVFIAVICISTAAYIARRHRRIAAARTVGLRAAGVAGLTTIAGLFTVLISFCILMLSISPNL